MDETLPKQAILIVNGGSRRGAELFAEARDKLKAAGVELLDSKKCKTAKSMETAVKSALKKAPMVIIGGGDGSLSSVVDFFIGTKVVFAFLPLGTANSFARTIGMPLDLDGAIEVIVTGEPRKIDVGCINGDYFLNAAAMGLAPKVADTVPHGLKRRLGRLGYLVWASWSAANFRAFRVKIEDGKRTVRMWATEVRIANGRYHGGIELIENADVKSGEIVIQVVDRPKRPEARLELFRVGDQAQGAAPDGAGVRRAEVHAQHQAADAGIDRREVARETPLEISAVPDAVTIAVPQELAAEGIPADESQQWKPISRRSQSTASSRHSLHPVDDKEADHADGQSNDSQMADFGRMAAQQQITGSPRTARRGAKARCRPVNWLHAVERCEQRRPNQRDGRQAWISARRNQASLTITPSSGS